MVFIHFDGGKLVRYKLSKTVSFCAFHITSRRRPEIVLVTSLNEAAFDNIENRV